MSTTTAPPTIAFFGATGGCTSATLALALKAGYKATALARTPSKLTTQLRTTHNIPDSTLNTSLTIVEGSIADIPAIRAVLTVPNSDGQRALAPTIVTGIGSTPTMTRNPLHPVTIADPHVCETATRNIVAALKELLDEGYAVLDSTVSTGDGKKDDKQKRPTLIAISTTGISPLQRDVPLLLLPVYHWLLAVPHADKAAMERVVVDASAANILNDFVFVRPTLLMGEARGVGSVKVGWERWGQSAEEAPGPMLGWKIAKEDVGAWIWEEGILRQGEWRGRCVSLSW